MLISRATAAGGELDDGGSVVVRVVVGAVVLVVDRVVVVPPPPAREFASSLVAAQMPMAVITTTRTTAAIPATTAQGLRPRGGTGCHGIGPVNGCGGGGPGGIPPPQLGGGTTWAWMGGLGGAIGPLPGRHGWLPAGPKGAAGDCCGIGPDGCMAGWGGRGWLVGSGCDVGRYRIVS